MISLWLAKFKGYLIGAIGLIVAVLTFGWSKKREGRKDAETKGDKDALENVAKAKEAESEADKISDVDSALRDNDWVQ